MSDEFLKQSKNDPAATHFVILIPVLYSVKPVLALDRLSLLALPLELGLGLALAVAQQAEGVDEGDAADFGPADLCECNMANFTVICLNYLT